MIRITKAKFKNFRLLRNVELEFSCNKEQPLTVIRAENGSGKTTVLTAMSWALFGDDALPGRRSTFRLHPIDWSTERESSTVRVSVEISFSMIDEETGLESRYDLIRSTEESLDAAGGFQSQRTDLVVLKKTVAGDDPILNPNAFIANVVMPPSLKDVFFIDGDRALAFIEAADEKSEKRERVESAVRSLLGLDILESAEAHVTTSRREALQQVKKDAQGTSLASLTDEEALLTSQIDGFEELKKQHISDRIATEGRKRKANDALREALASGAGDRKKLESDLSNTVIRLAAEREQERVLIQQHRNLMHNSVLLYEIAGGVLNRSARLLNDLEERKVIPNTLPEVVQDRLRRGTCICGSDVSPGSVGHRALSNLLEESQHLDESHGILLHLSTALRRAAIAFDNPEGRWSQLARESFERITRSGRNQRDAEELIADYRATIKQIPDKNIGELERMLYEEEKEYSRLTSDIAKLTERIANKSDELRRVVLQRTDAQKKESKYIKSLAEETAAKDLLGVIKDTIDTLENETLSEVSIQMNEIFLAMIVTDTEQNGIIQSAELTKDHDIIVHGPFGKLLDPDRDLSGAQRRALTLAFILALITVSGVRAPNVIDTPLGMTSGPVRRSILEITAKQSSQPILFLTGSEIAGVEDLLDQYSGKTFTLTNTDHFPQRLKHDPGSEHLETLVCECNHRSFCRICERVGHV